MNAIEHDFPKFSKWRPSEFDARGVGAADNGHWLVMPWGTNRDADTLTRANWLAACKALPEGENVQVHRFRHGGPGWIEVMIVRPGTPEHEKAAEMAAALADYSVLDETIYSELEVEAQSKAWEDGEWKEWVQKAIETGFPAFHSACMDYLTAETAWDIFQEHGQGIENKCFHCTINAYDGDIDPDEADKEFAALMADISVCRKQRDIGLAEYPRIDWLTGYSQALDTIAEKMVDLGFDAHFVNAIIETQR